MSWQSWHTSEKPGYGWSRCVICLDLKGASQMNEEDRQRQMDFIVAQQAAFSSEMIELKSRVDKTSENLDRMAASLERLAGVVEQQARTAEINRREMRDAIENLIIGNEVARDLTNKAGQSAIDVSQRLAGTRA